MINHSIKEYFFIFALTRPFFTRLDSRTHQDKGIWADDHFYHDGD